jgi:methionyl aminopeptidase
VELKTRDQLVQMRRAGLVVASALAAVRAAVRPGVRTRELDAVAAEVIRSAGATSSFLGYGADQGVGGFRGVTCLSVNEEVVHGVPGDRVLVEGDLLSVDCGAVVDGWHGDAAVTVSVGDAAPAEALALSEATRSALGHGIAAARLGGHVGDISAAVERHVRSFDAGYGIVEEYVGHGIGSAMHQPPDVPSVSARGQLRGLARRGPRIVEGLALAVEPMLTLGGPANHVLADDWTVVITDDGRLAAHWEHTMTVTERGIWVLTAEDGGEQLLAALGAPFGPLAD